MIVCVIFTIFNINFPFFISWKLNGVFVHLACHRWYTNLLDVDLIKEDNLGGCHIWKLLFVGPGWFMPYLDLPPFGNNEQYVDGEMSQVIVFVYVFSFNFSLTLSPLEVC